MTKYRLHLSDLKMIAFDSKNLSYTIDECGVQDFNTSYIHESVNGQFTEIITENFRISYGKGKFLKDTTVIDFEFEEETVEMHFTLQGDFLTKISEDSTHHTIQNNQHNIFYASNPKGQLWCNSPKSFVFEVNMLPSFFLKHLPAGHKFDEFKKAILSHQISALHPHNYPISRAMYMVIQEIINCQWKNTFRLLFLESKILELLLLQLTQISEYDNNLSPKRPSKAIMEKMHYAKSLIEKNISYPMSLATLAREANTNECTLKKEFKNIFGTTVFGYVRDMKMEEAKKILLEHSLSINEVSDIVGYKNPQHFSTAFKKKFGISPSTLKINDL